MKVLRQECAWQVEGIICGWSGRRVRVLGDESYEGKDFYLHDIKSQWKDLKIEETSDLPLTEPLWWLD